MALEDQDPAAEIEEQRRRLANALRTGVVENPDALAADRAEAQRRGIPVSRLRAIRETQGALPPAGYAADLPARAPATSNFLSNPANAAVAHDDIENLTGLERIVARIGEGTVRVVSDFAGAAETAIGGVEPFVRRQLDRAGIPSFDAVRDERTGAISIVRSTPQTYARGLRLADAAEGREAIPQGITWEEFKQRPLERIIPFALEEGVVSLPDMVAAVAALPFYVASRTGGISEERAQNDGRQDATIEDLVAALPAATGSALLERIGTRGIIGLDDVVRGGARGIPGAVGRAAVKETITEGLQEGIEYAGASVGTEAGFDPVTALDRMAQGAVVGGPFGATVRATTATVDIVSGRFAAREAEAANAERAAETLQDLTTLSQASKLRERDPQSFQQFVEQLTESGPLENLYVDAQTFAQSLNDAGVSLEEVTAAIPTLAEQLPAALASAGEVRITAGEFAAHIANTDAVTALLPHLRDGRDPNSMSQAQAQEFMATRGEALQAEIEAASAQVQASEELRAGRERVQTRITEELNTTGRFTKDVNAAYATLPSAFYDVMGARLGITAEQAAERYPLKFAAELPASVSPNTLEQEDGVDLVHFSDSEGLTASDPKRWGATRATQNGERERRNAGAPGRTYFGVQGVYQGEQGVGIGKRPYQYKARVPASKLYDFDADPQNLKPTEGTPAEVATAYEAAIQAAGFSGYRSDAMIPGAVAMFDSVEMLQEYAQSVRAEPLQGAPSTNQPFGPARMAAEEYMAEAGIAYTPATTYAKVDPERAKRIADEFEAMKHDPENPEVKAAYRAMIDETLAQWQVIKATGLKVEFIDFEKTGDPYAATPRLAILDVVENNHLWVFPTDAGFGSGSSLVGNEAVYEVLLDETGSGPFDGGCVLMARAIQKRLGGELVALTNAEGKAQHAVVKVGDTFYDADGAASSLDAILTRFNAEEDAQAVDGRPLAKKDLPDAPRGSAKAVAKLEAAIPVSAYADISGNPLLEPTGEFIDGRELLANDVFRIVHDYFGHIKDGNGFRADGEENAWQSHAAVYTPLARRAMTTETRGQNSWVNFGPKAEFNRTASAGETDYADQKIGLLPEWVSEEGFLGADNPSPAVLNVGLLIDATQENIPTARAIEVVREQGGQIARVTERRSATEQTAIFELAAPLTPAAAARVSEALSQDAVAQRVMTGEGELYGPKADSWRPFNSDFFLEPEPGSTFYQSDPGRVRELELRAVARNALTVEGYDQTPVAQPLVDRAGPDVEDDAQVLVGETSSPQLDSPTGTPPLFRVFAQVRAAALVDAQVLDAIVDLVPVDVVDNLFGSKSAAKMALHDEPVFQVGDAVDADLAVAQAVDAASPVALLLDEGARLAAEGGFATDTRREAEELTAAARANEREGFGPEASGVEVRTNSDTLAQRNRAQIAFGTDITQTPSVISLLRAADLSSFGHETGHFFLEASMHMANAPDAPADIVADMVAVLNWFEPGMTLAQWNGMSTEQRRPYHEKWARGFEAYLFEGRSPSLALRDVFRRFSAWLKNVYKSLTALDVELTDEVRQVMDRMLASEAEIAEMEQVRGLTPAFKEKPEFASAEEWTEYQKLGAEATAEAIEQLETRSARDMRWASGAKDRYLRSLQRESEEQRKAIRAEVTAEVMAEPVNRARSFLRRGLGENGEPVEGATKLDLETLKALYPADGTWTKLRRGGKYGEVSTDGLHPDIVASMFGYPSGEAMIDALVNGEDSAEKIKGLTDQRMLERYGDLSDAQSIERAANEAVANEARGKFVAAEMAMADKAIGKKSILNSAAREFAASVVNRLELKRLRPAQYLAAQGRAAKAAEKALKGDDLPGFATAKRNQLINLHTGRAVQQAQKDVEKTMRLFTRIVSAKDDSISRSRNMDLVNAARAILSSYGVGRAKNDPAGYMKALASYDPTLWADIEPFVSGARGDAKPVVDLTYEQFTALRDTVAQLWALSRRTKQIEIDGKLMDREVVTTELGLRLEEIGIPDQAGTDRAPTDKDNRVRDLLGVRAALRRVESWARGVDQADSGPFRKYIWNPISTASDAYRAESGVYIKRFRALLDEMRAELKPGDIKAPEIGYTFGGKSELFHALLHTGNGSNKSKLLLGRSWGKKNEDGSLDDSRWQALIDRLHADGVLTEKDWTFVQAVWDLLEETKPGAQKAHHAIYGRYFDEVSADPVDTPFGQLRGGYVPAMTDGFLVQDAVLRAEQEAIEGGDSAMFPAASNGFTKSRDEDYTRELALDLRLLPMHIDKVLKFTHLGPPVRDVARLLKDRSFSKTLQAFDPTAQTDLLLPWLQRAAKQLVETPSKGRAGKATDRFFSAVRSRVGMQLMFANVVNTAQQLTGFSNVMLRVKPANVGDALWRYVRDPKGVTEAAASQSVFLTNRMNSDIFEARQTIAQLTKLNPSKKDEAVDFLKRHAYFMQSALQNVMDVVSWTAAFNQAVAKGESDRDAGRFADSVIRETQGTMAPEDVSRFETGAPFVRMFTQFAGYFNMMANLNATEVQIVARGVGLKRGMGRLFYVYLMGFAIPALLGDAIAKALRGGWEDEDEDGYMDDLFAWFFSSQAKFALAAVPVVGQAGNALIGTTTGLPYDDRLAISPAVSVIESGVKVPSEVYQSLVEGESFNRTDVRNTLNLLGVLTGTPTGALAKPVGYGVGVAQGDIEPTGPVDAARGVVTGAPSPESRVE